MSVNDHIVCDRVLTKAAACLDLYLVLALGRNTAVAVQKQCICCVYQRDIHICTHTVQQHIQGAHSRLFVCKIVSQPNQIAVFTALPCTGVIRVKAQCYRGLGRRRGIDRAVGMGVENSIV